MGVDAHLDSLVAGYRVERLLGRGGMGAVYLADDVQLARKVALKLLVPELSEDASFRERFLRESRIAAGLEHPNVVPIYQAGDADGTLFIAMRYVEGTDLRRLLAERPLAAADVAAIAEQVAAALDAAHEAGLVHRDVKPANVLIDRREHVYLSDFGLTKQTASQSGLTATGTLVGTLDYVAPEQIQGHPVDGRADVYSLACLIHECLTGKPPFRRDTDVATLWAHVQESPPATGDTAVDAVLAKGLAKDPDQRYSTAGQLADDLRHALDVSSGAVSAPTAPTGRSRSRLLLIGAAVVAAVAAVVVVAVLASRGSGTKGLAAVPSQSVGLIDPKNGRIVAAIHVGPNPTRAAIGEDAVWVASTNDATLLRIDPRTRQVVKTIGLGFDPFDIAVAPRGVYLADPGNAAVVRVDTDSNTVSESTRIGKLGSGISGPVAAPQHLAYGAGSIWGDARSTSTLMFRLRLDSNSVKIVDLGEHSPNAFAYADGALWTADWSNGTISRIEPADNAVTATIPLGALGQAPFATALGASAAGIWAIGTPPQAGGGSYSPDFSKIGRAFHIDPRLNGVVASVPVGRSTLGGADAAGLRTTTNSVAAAGADVWVLSGGDGSLMEIDATKNAVVKTIQVGKDVDGVAIGAGYVWVSRL